MLNSLVVTAAVVVVFHAQWCIAGRVAVAITDSSLAGTVSPPASCGAFVGCDTCLENAVSGCGWCAIDQVCTLGSSQGPTEGSCGVWFWQQCPNCAPQSSCEYCVARAGCGYCQTDGTSFCTEGSSTAPYNMSLSCGAWSYAAASSCPMSGPVTPPPYDGCSTLTTCSFCEESFGICGWCATTQTCVPGTSEGPSSGFCPDYYTNNCPYCQYQGTCGECLSNFNCGWCQPESPPTAPGSVVYCFEGAATGPFNQSLCPATQWFYGRQVCPAPLLPSVTTCAKFSSCDQCQTVTGCGWCAESQRCVPGQSTGPEYGTCTWWYSDGCPYCGLRSECEYCRMSQLCGWCGNATVGVCLEGTAGVPYNLSACPNLANWVHWPDTCPSPPPPPCYKASTCGGCQNITGCGWCESAQQCFEGNWEGPTLKSCAAGWYGEDNCPGCSQQTGCASCVALDGDVCGWCTDTKQCLVGNASGPFNPYADCTNWTEPGGDCYYDPCSIHEKCPECRADTTHDCGWCAMLGTCQSGTAAGPSFGYCGDWYWEGCPSGMCSSYSDCASCVASPPGDCGWCTTTKVCSDGTASGPSSATCNGAWEWTPPQCVD